MRRQDSRNRRGSVVAAATSEVSAITRVAQKLARNRKKIQPPKINSFAEFLAHHAQVKTGPSYTPYHFTGREALQPIVQRLDQILASGDPDCSLALCGGAQFGKTVLMLNLLAYLVAVKFRNVGYYLPDDDLVSGLVDGKLRPDVLDQIPWLARLIAVGKTLNASGRAVNRKGAFLCTDGKRTALAFMRGLGKIPTSFSMDVVIQDEKDDLPEEHARFLSGRMTASNLRLSLIIGTQRYHGAGQNLAFTEGTQHIGLITCPLCARKHNPETLWPGICRLVVEGRAPSKWPRLTPEGHFSAVAAAVLSGGRKEDGLTNSISSDRTPPLGTAAATAYAPGQSYALCCLDCGTELDRSHPEWHAQAPEREVLRKWSYRISQLLMPGIDLAQIVAAWQLAIRDPAQMTVFCTDRLALPKSTTQTLTPGVLEGARENYVLVAAAQRAAATTEVAYGGLDLGDQCWFVARAVEVKPPHTVRLLWVEPMAAERVRQRVPELFRELGLRALCVDAGPLRDLARDLAFVLNQIDEDEEETTAVRRTDGYPEGNLRWHEASQKWRNARCAPVEFTQREGQGLRHKIGRTQEGRIYPLLAAHRDESIERVVQELLPPDAAHPRLLERADGTAVPILTPRFLLPQPTEETRAVLETYERHLLAGARQERSADGRTLRYLDKCENHFLLATAYAALAELLAPIHTEEITVAAFRSLPGGRMRVAKERSVVG